MASLEKLYGGGIYWRSRTAINLLGPPKPWGGGACSKICRSRSVARSHAVRRWREMSEKMISCVGSIRVRSSDYDIRLLTSILSLSKLKQSPCQREPFRPSLRSRRTSLVGYGLFIRATFGYSVTQSIRQVMVEITTPRIGATGSSTVQSPIRCACGPAT